MASDRPWIGWAAVAVGVSAVVAAFAASSTRVGEGIAFGFGAFIVFFGVLAVLASDRTPDLWGLVVVGLAMFIAPFIGNGYQLDLGASWTCWVAGALAMILGGIGWTRVKQTEGRPDEIGSTRTQRSSLSYWIARAALLVGLGTVLLGVTGHNNTAPETAVLVALGGLTAVIAVWALLAVDPTHDYLTLAVTGFALFLSPWVAGFAGDKSGAWTAWAAGALSAALGVAGYLRGERLDFASTVRDDASEQYRQRFRR